MADLYVKRFDTLPVVEATLGFLSSPTDDTALAAALADGATVVSFIMRLATETGAPKVNAAAIIEDAANRIVSYQWTGTDTDTAGDYHAEWEVKHPDGRVQTFPTTGYHEITVVPDLDEAGQA